MSDLTISSDFDFDADSLMRCVILGPGLGLVAGEAITKGMGCYIKSDGKVYKAVNTVTTMNGQSDFDGIAYDTYASGENVTLVGNGGVMVAVDSGLTPGAPYYVSSTAGKIASTPLTTDSPIAKAVSATLLIIQSLGRTPDIVS